MRIIVVRGAGRVLKIVVISRRNWFRGKAEFNFASTFVRLCLSFGVLSSRSSLDLALTDLSGVVVSVKF